jgi:Protease inhibitor Inh
MIRLVICSSLMLLGLGGARAQTPPAQLSEAAKSVIGSWEISNAERDKRCPVIFNSDAAAGGMKLELDPACMTAFPPFKDVVAWGMGVRDALRLLDAKGATILELSEVESGIWEGERRGEGLFFMQSQAAATVPIRTAKEMFGDWQFLREADMPLCKFTLSNAGDGPDKYKIVVKPGCVAEIANFGLTTWQLDRDQLVITGRGGAWRFVESDLTLWERIPPSTNPLLMMK